MKKTITVLAMLLFVALSSRAQNFVAPEKERTSYTDTTTTYTYQIKDTKYPVFKSRSGAFYIWKTSSKTSKKYKYYLPKEIQVQMGRKYDTSK